MTGSAPGHQVDAVQQLARERLPAEVFRYFSQGSGQGITAAEATAAWDRLRLLPRALVDVTSVDVTTTLLGTPVRSPFGVAPTTLQRAAHPDGELAMAEGAREAGALLVVSSNAGTTFDQIGEVGAPWWLQMYVTADRSTTAPVVERAVEAGARALVLTADTPVVARKYAGRRTVWDVVEPGWVRRNFEGVAIHAAAAEKASDLGPQDVAWLADTFGLPVVVKGVLHPADARRCVDAGAAAVWVSNHGGRQLDRTVATADALAAVADEVGTATELYVDGGIRCGGHALAAGALGARAVFLGRPPLYALAAGGAAGVAELLVRLVDDLVEGCRLAGATSFEALTRELIWPGAGL